MNTTTQQHTLQAWTKEGDFVPTLYIQGEITTNGEKPMVELIIAEPQGIVAEVLILNMQPDVYDPNGMHLLRIKNFSLPLKTNHQYNSVTIQAAKGEIHLKVQQRPR